MRQIAWLWIVAVCMIVGSMLDSCTNTTQNKRLDKIEREMTKRAGVIQGAAGALNAVSGHADRLKALEAQARGGLPAVQGAGARMLK